MENRRCPECDTVLPVDPEYVTWCPTCEWNLNPLGPDKPKNLYESTYEKLGQKQSDYLFARLQEVDSLEPRVTFSKFLAILFSLAIHLLTLTLPILGVVLLSDEFRNICTFIPMVVCFLLAWELRPRFAKMPTILARSEFPNLYQFVDDIADALGAKKVEGICIDDQYNASIGSVTWRQRPIMTLGLPLWSITNLEERAALVGHEMAHSINGDLSRTFLVGTALNSLVRWYLVLYPRRLEQGCLTSVVNTILVTVAQLPWLGIYVLAHLLYRDSQRAEYLADYKAATLAGTDAVLALLEKLYFYGTYVTVWNRVTAVQSTGVDFFQELARRIVRVPEQEIERIRRLQQVAGSRLNVTHPPTPYRIEMLKNHVVSQPLLNWAEYDLAQLDEELSQIKDDMRLKLSSGDQYHFLKRVKSSNQ